MGKLNQSVKEIGIIFYRSGTYGILIASLPLGTSKAQVCATDLGKNSDEFFYLFALN